MSLASVYKAVKESPRLADMEGSHTIGKLSAQGAQAAPRIEWRLFAGDKFSDPHYSEVDEEELADGTTRPLVVNGQHVVMTSPMTREAGAEIRLYWPAGAPDDPEPYEQMEDLIRRFVLALHDTLRSRGGSYEIEGAAGEEPETAETTTLCYVLSLTVKIPIWDTLPAATARTRTVRT